jgi:hypothetical protein
VSTFEVNIRSLDILGIHTRLWAHNESLSHYGKGKIGKGCWGMVGRAGNLELATLQPRHPGWFAEWSSTCCQSAAKVQGWSFEQGPQVRGGQGKV